MIISSFGANAQELVLGAQRIDNILKHLSNKNIAISLCIYYIVSYVLYHFIKSFDDRDTTNPNLKNNISYNTLLKSQVIVGIIIFLVINYLIHDIKKMKLVN